MKHAATVVSSLFLLLPLALSAEPRIPPQPNCLDARQIDGAEGIDASTIAIRLKDGQRFQVQLAQECQSPANRLSVRGARGGWLCGSPGETLLIAGNHCPVSAVAPLDSRDYADLLRQRDQQKVATLAPLQVEAPRSRSRGFRGSADYCVGIQNVRNWSETPQGVTVEVSPKRAAGNRYYRIELANGCPSLTNAQNMTLVSGLGIGMVCGHPGDRMQLNRPERELIRPGDRANSSDRFDCQISQVYPIQRKD